MYVVFTLVVFTLADLSWLVELMWFLMSHSENRQELRLGRSY